MQIITILLLGITLFVVGEIIVKLFIDPIQRHNMAIAKVINVLIATAGVYCNPKSYTPTVRARSRSMLRQVSGEMLVSSIMLPFWPVLSAFRIVRSKNSIYTAHMRINKIATSLESGMGQNNSSDSVIAAKMLGFEDVVDDAQVCFMTPSTGKQQVSQQPNQRANSPGHAIMQNN